MILFGNMDTPTVNQNTIKDLKVTDTTPQFPDRREVVQQQKIEAEKAAEAARQAEAQRQAQVATQTAQASYRPAPVAVTGSCGEWMAAAGVTDVANAYILIMRESGCNPNALNRSSGACGIPQALPCSKLGTSDPVAQIRWMELYIRSRYGSWANAVAHSNATGWY